MNLEQWNPSAMLPDTILEIFMTRTIESMTAELEAMKQSIKQAKQANRPKTPVTATLHTAKDSGKLSIKVAQGFRSAYLNAEQILFIIANGESMIAMTKNL
jgi:hypothetical protein